MANLVTPQTFEFFAQYVLAGFLLIMVANAFVDGRRPKPAEAFFEAVLYSLLNQLVWSLLVTVAAWLFDLRPQARMAFYLQVLVQPVLLGWLIGKARQKNWLRPVFRTLSMPIMEPHARAYDDVFMNFVGRARVIVAYQDGTNLYGLFGYDSRAGRDPDHRDLYLELLYDVNEHGEWSPSVPPRGALISLEGMRAIEIMPVTESEGENDAAQADH
jgi:hypothetical protein